ncbi:NmrA-like family domain-containing protein 1 [Colletotrichum spaethianum]|uniref:NmrA-like family domain-containing protein 1 n=1 Tax=Colletotrichum spaethianum TaxID=700344 RepID=A0AA37PEX8_9PEZI|nr:NmrA-like family domain-containing protein 1 [Colletotrichum spaethianum]GKT51053.1 NmrA-like family domain-containing protein 1 [Colletotrichum spaethianum]
MADTKLIVIIGITGNQGSSVANIFLSLPGWRIRGITRDPSSAAALAWKSKNVELVQGDVDDIPSLKRAFSGASSIFAVTNFWGHMFDPSNYPKAQQAGLSINEFAYQREISQGMNMAVAASAPEILSTLTHFVFSSLSNAKKWSRGKYTQNWHFDGKAVVTDRIRAELPGLAAKLSIVQVGTYASNWKNVVGRPLKQDDGSFLISIPAGQSSPIPWIVVDQDTGIFVKALVEQPAGKTVLALSEWATWTGFWTLWSEVLGLKTEFKEVSPSEYVESLPEPARAEFLESMLYSNEFGYTGGDPDVLSLPDLDSQAKPTGLREYMETEDWSPLME